MTINYTLRKFMSYYYHGSDHEFEIGDGIYPMNTYTTQKEVQALEKLFEEERPESCQFSRLDCVYMTAEFEHLDFVGAHEEFSYLVDIEDGFCEESDLAWYSKATTQLEEGNVEGARESARKYWSGEEFEIFEHSAMEFRTDECYIIEIVG